MKTETPLPAVFFRGTVPWGPGLPLRPPHYALPVELGNDKGFKGPRS